MTIENMSELVQDAVDRAVLCNNVIIAKLIRPSSARELINFNE